MTISPPLKYRIRSIDMLRGAIMLIMAIDHTRDYFHLAGMNNDPTNLVTTTPILFFTRWITHFCAPTFVFLGGVSAYIAGTRRTKSELSAFLFKRGLWLVFAEIIIITFAFTLNPFYNVIILQVIWVTGLSMILLAGLVWLPLRVIAITGIVIFLGHDILNYIKLPQSGISSILIKLIFSARGSIIPLGNNHFLFDLYAILPWTGVMLLGYTFGSMYTSSFDPARRKRILVRSALGLLVIFLILRGTNLYGDPAPWSVQRSGLYTIMSFLNVSKYPPSLLYLCMTLSPALLILAFTEKLMNKFTDILTVYGSVPFLYYIMHFYLIRLFTVISFFMLGYKPSQIVTPDSPSLFTPPGAGYNLGIVYLIWFVIIVILYFPCRWYMQYKKTHTQWWLSYL